MSHELRAFADQLCKEDFRCLSQGIGIFTRPSKSNILPKSHKQQFSVERKPSSQPKILDGQENVGKDSASSYQRDRCDQFVPPKKNSQVQRPQSIYWSSINKILAWSLDAVFVIFSLLLVFLAYSFSKGFFELSQKQWLFSLFEKFLEQMPLMFIGLGGFLLLLMYGLLFRFIVGATLGEAIISRFLVRAKSQKNKRLYNNFI